MTNNILENNILENNLTQSQEVTLQEATPQEITSQEITSQEVTLQEVTLQEVTLQEAMLQEEKSRKETNLSLALKLELKNKIHKLSKILELPENLSLEDKITKIITHWNKVSEKIQSLDHRSLDHRSLDHRSLDYQSPDYQSDYQSIYSQHFLGKYLSEYTKRLKFTQTHKILLNISEKILQDTLVFLNFLIENHFQGQFKGPILLDDISNFLNKSIENHKKEEEYVNSFYSLLNLQRNYNFEETFSERIFLSLKKILGERTLEQYIKNQEQIIQRERESLNNIFFNKKTLEIEKILNSLKVFQNYLNHRNMSYRDFGIWLENNEIYENKIKFIENCFQDSLENISLHFEVLQSYKLTLEENKTLDPSYLEQSVLEQSVLEQSVLEQFINIFFEIGGKNLVENLKEILENKDFLNLSFYLSKLEIGNSMELFLEKVQKIENILKNNNIENIGNYLREIEEFQTMKKSINPNQVLEKINNLRNFHGFIKTLQNYDKDKNIIDFIEKFMPLYDFMNMLLRISTNHNIEFSGNLQNISNTINNFFTINYFINFENSIPLLERILKEKNIKNYSDIKEQKKKIKMFLEKKIDYNSLRENAKFIKNLENILLKHSQNLDLANFYPTLESSKKYNKNEKLLNIIYEINSDLRNNLQLLGNLENFLENNRERIIEKLNLINQISEKIPLKFIIEFKKILRNNSNYNLEIIEKNIRILRKNNINLEQEINNQEKYNKILLEISTLIKNFNHIYGKKIIQNIANISLFLQLFLRESDETIECYNSIASFDFSIISKNYSFYKNLLEKRTIKEIENILQKFPEISLHKIKKEVEEIVQFFQKIYNSIKNVVFLPEKNIQAILSMHSVLKDKNISILDIIKKNKNILEQISLEFLNNLNLLTRKKTKKISSNNILNNILETIISFHNQNNIDFLSSIRLNPNSEYLPDLFIILIQWIAIKE